MATGPRAPGVIERFREGFEYRNLEARMAFEVPPLPYDYAALEPHIDEATMRVHHDKHHQAYVDKANADLEGTDFADKSIEETLSRVAAPPAEKQKAVENNVRVLPNHFL